MMFGRSCGTLMAACLFATPIWAETTLTCVKTHWYDGEKRSYTVVFDDANRRAIIVNGVDIPDEDAGTEWYINGFDDARVGWCMNTPKMRTHICHQIDRVSGEFTVTYLNKGKQDRGSCTKGNVPADRKF